MLGHNHRAGNQVAVRFGAENSPPSSSPSAEVVYNLTGALFVHFRGWRKRKIRVSIIITKLGHHYLRGLARVLLGAWIAGLERSPPSLLAPRTPTVVGPSTGNAWPGRGRQWGSTFPATVCSNRPQGRDVKCDEHLSARMVGLLRRHLIITPRFHSPGCTPAPIPEAHTHTRLR